MSNNKRFILNKSDLKYAILHSLNYNTEYINFYIGKEIENTENAFKIEVNSLCIQTGFSNFRISGNDLEGVDYKNESHFFDIVECYLQDINTIKQNLYSDIKTNIYNDEDIDFNIYILDEDIDTTINIIADNFSEYNEKELFFSYELPFKGKVETIMFSKNCRQEYTNNNLSPLYVIFDYDLDKRKYKIYSENLNKNKK